MKIFAIRRMVGSSINLRLPVPTKKTAEFLQTLDPDAVLPFSTYCGLFFFSHAAAENVVDSLEHRIAKECKIVEFSSI